MTITYDSVFSRFLAKVRDFNIPEYTDEISTELMTDWLDEALSDPYITKKFSELSYSDETGELTIELRNPIGDFRDEKLVIAILSSGMVIAWLTPLVYSKENILQMYGGKEEKYYSQQQHLATLNTLLDDTRTRLRKFIRDEGYINNSYLNGDD